MMFWNTEIYRVEVSDYKFGNNIWCFEIVRDMDTYRTSKFGNNIWCFEIKIDPLESRKPFSLVITYDVLKLNLQQQLEAERERLVITYDVLKF